MMTGKLCALFGALVITLIAPGARALAAPGPSLATLRKNGAREVQSVFVRTPQNAPSGQPTQVLVALHGMGGNGSDFGGAFASQADANNWLIVAPTISYGDWTNPDQIAREDPALIAWLSDEINQVTQTYGLPGRVLFFGHSRGAQLALRFTEVHPEQVAGVAAVSAGTYTLPVAFDASSGQTLNFPYGVADLAQTDGGSAFNVQGFDAVPIWIGVGAADNNDADVPDAWDPYIGPDRLDRAQAFTQALQSLGANVSLTVFPNTDHTLTDDMRAAGCTMLAGDVS
jgi:predicted esterase